MAWMSGWPRTPLRKTSPAESAAELSAFTRSLLSNPNMRKTFNTGLSTPFVAKSRKPSKYG